MFPLSRLNLEALYLARFRGDQHARWTTADGAVLNELNPPINGSLDLDGKLLPALGALDQNLFKPVHAPVYLLFGYFDSSRIPPEGFERVNIPLLHVEDMNDDTSVIDDHPLTAGKSILRDGPQIDGVADFSTD